MSDPLSTIIAVLLVSPRYSMRHSGIREAGEEAEAKFACGAGADDHEKGAEAAAGHQCGHEPAAAGAAGQDHHGRRGRRPEREDRP